LIHPTVSGPGALGSTAQLCDVHARLCAANGAVIGVNHMPGDSISRYGAIRIAETLVHPDGNAMRLSGFVEKPKPADAPSQFGAIGRYVLPASIFAHLKDIKRGAGGEIQLTDAIASLMSAEPVYAVQTVGVRYDCGTKLGYLEATVKLGLEHPEFGGEFATFLKQQL
jgi:UTP--glucose-1-phosphate uridylyltransferase